MLDCQEAQTILNQCHISFFDFFSILQFCLGPNFLFFLFLCLNMKLGEDRGVVTICIYRSQPSSQSLLSPTNFFACFFTLLTFGLLFFLVQSNSTPPNRQVKRRSQSSERATQTDWQVFVQPPVVTWLLLHHRLLQACQHLQFWLL